MPLRGLTVSSSSGHLLRDGMRFRNIGMNYGGGIVRIYSQPSSTACAYTPSAEQEAMLDLAAEMKVKVLRVKATPYWPAQWRYGVNGGVAGVTATSGDREAHYIKIDQFLDKCQSRGIGVILNLFFRHASVADLAGQTVRAGWLTPGSATRSYAQAVTQEIVTRYLTHDAVYGYEFGNELNHYNDAADAALGSFPGVNTGYGSQASYSAANTAFKGDELSGLLAWWYDVVRAIDSQRIVLTGNGPNSYSRPGGAAGISWPLKEWYVEQVRDNPTNCGSIHWYGGVGYGSPSFRGLDAILTGVRHWQRMSGRGFVLGEFGCNPWTITALSGDGATLTATVVGSCPVEPGDSVQIGGTGSVFDGQTVSLSTVNAGRTVLTAPCGVSGSWSGSVKGLQHTSQDRMQRMCRDIIDSGTDVALFWMLDGDPGRPIFESLTEATNAGIRAAILAANTELGW